MPPPPKRELISRPCPVLVCRNWAQRLFSMRSRKRETLEHLAIALASSGTAARREGDWVGRNGARRHARVRLSMTGYEVERSDWRDPAH
jgi:hypothetical protein